MDVSSAQVWREVMSTYSIDNTNEPLIPRTMYRVVLCDVKLHGERKVSTVGTGLIPSLDGGGERTQHHCKDQRTRLAPFVCASSLVRGKRKKRGVV
jgi:hypothetical protein